MTRARVRAPRDMSIPADRSEAWTRTTGHQAAHRLEVPAARDSPDLVGGGRVGTAHRQIHDPVVADSRSAHRCRAPRCIGDLRRANDEVDPARDAGAMKHADLLDDSADL